MKLIEAIKDRIDTFFLASLRNLDDFVPMEEWEECSKKEVISTKLTPTQHEPEPMEYDQIHPPFIFSSTSLIHLPPIFP